MGEPGNRGTTNPRRGPAVSASAGSGQVHLDEEEHEHDVRGAGDVLDGGTGT